MNLRPYNVWIGAQFVRTVLAQSAADAVQQAYASGLITSFESTYATAEAA